MSTFHSYAIYNYQNQLVLSGGAGGSTWWQETIVSHQVPEELISLYSSLRSYMLLLQKNIVCFLEACFPFVYTFQVITK